MNNRGGLYSVLALVVGCLIVDRVCGSYDNAVDNGVLPEAKLTQDGISMSTAPRLDTTDIEPGEIEESEDTEA